MYDPASLLLAAYYMLGLPGGSDGKNLPAVWETWFRSLRREDSLEKEMATHSSTLAWKIPWTVELGAGCCPWGCKESDMTEQVTLLYAEHRARHFTHTTLFNPHNAR